MNKLLFILLMSFQAFSFISGECRPMPSSKVYINGNFSLPYPKKVSFSCKYECLADEIEVITAISEVEIKNLEQDAKNVVCQGVKVIKKNWGYEFDSAEPFFAYDTNLVELKTWARDNQIGLDSPAALELERRLRDTLYQVGTSYAIAGNSSQPFKEASIIILKMSADLALLDEYLEQMRQSDFKIGAEFTAQNLIYRVIYSTANWRILPNN